MHQAGQDGTDPGETAPLGKDESAGETRLFAPLSADARQLARSFLGQTLGDYRIVREIGHGSMGIVYEALNVRLGQTVALKVLPPSLSVTETVIRRFLREAQSVAKLVHENIVQIHSIGDQGGVFYYAMQLVEGAPLDKAMRERRFSARDSAAIVAQAARALFFAHDHGIIHRDVKPANIILSYKDRPVLTDFGLARPEKAGTLTESGALVGTPIYMSPEQVCGDRSQVGRRTDIYSLGVTLYEMLTGTTPFQGESTQEILHKIECEEPRPVRRLRPEVPRDLETICHKAIEKDPDRRYQTAIEFALDLERFLAGEPISARRTALHTRLLKKVRRHRVISLLASLVVIAVVVILVGGMRSRGYKQSAARAEYAENLATGANLVRRRAWAEAIAVFDRALAADPNGLEALVERGKCHFIEESHEAAVADFEKALEIDPGNSRAKMWHGLSKCRYGDSSERLEGIDEFWQTLGEHPDDPECLLEAARLCVELASLTQNLVERDALINAGCKWVGRLLQLNPNDDQALVLQALFLQEQGMDDLARRTLEKATKINPNNERAWLLLYNDPEEDAAAAGADSEESDETMPVVAPWWGILAAHGVNWASRRLSAEEDFVSRAVDALMPWDTEQAGEGESPPAGEQEEQAEVERLLAEADSLWSENQTEPAARTYLEVLALNPQLAEPNNRLAEHFLTSGRDLDRACRHVEQARTIAPANFRTLFVALRVYTAQNNREKAREVIDAIGYYYPALLTLPYVHEVLQGLSGAEEDGGAPPAPAPADEGQR